MLTQDEDGISGSLLNQAIKYARGPRKAPKSRQTTQDGSWQVSGTIHKDMFSRAQTGSEHTAFSALSAQLPTILSGSSQKCLELQGLRHSLEASTSTCSDVHILIHRYTHTLKQPFKTFKERKIFLEMELMCSFNTRHRLF